MGFERDIVGVVIVVSGLGFPSYRLERASEPKGSRAKQFVKACYKDAMLLRKRK